MIWFSRAQADCWGITRYPFSSESGFGKSDPCAIKAITGRTPRAQSAWRVDFKRDGYRAFLRPSADDEREFELSLFCDENLPGTLFVTMDIGGPAAIIRDAIVSVTLDAPPVVYRTAPFSISQVDDAFSRLTIHIKNSDVIGLLTQANDFQIRVALKPSYSPMSANTFLSNSRKALLFAANNCVNQKRS